MSNGGSDQNSKLVKACDEFYTRVPHDFGSVGNNHYSTLNGHGVIESACTRVDYKYSSIKTKINYLLIKVTNIDQR